MRQIIEGTTEELVQLLQSGEYAGRRARVIFESEDEISSGDIPDPPNWVRSFAALDQRLLEGLASPMHELDSEVWDDVRREIRRRREAPD